MESQPIWKYDGKEWVRSEGVISGELTPSVIYPKIIATTVSPPNNIASSNNFIVLGFSVCILGLFILSFIIFNLKRKLKNTELVQKTNFKKHEEALNKISGILNSMTVINQQYSQDFKKIRDNIKVSEPKFQKITSDFKKIITDLKNIQNKNVEFQNTLNRLNKRR